MNISYIKIAIKDPEILKMKGINFILKDKNSDSKKET